MSYTRIINGIKYLELFNDNNFKDLSLEDNVYFTLRDIFLNIYNYENVIKANNFNSELTGNVPYEKRKSDFQYTNVLNDKLYVNNLNEQLKYIRPCYFEFEEFNNKKDEEEQYYDMTNLINFNVYENKKKT